MKIAQFKPADPADSAVVKIPIQPASLDIWDSKYRLKAKNGTPVDTSVDGTYQRVARALANVEALPERRDEWYGKFLWALRHGAIPAGRIVSNAGALEHKPATSTINCTVSGTIEDSMDDILQKVHEAGLTLKYGSGIGYEFSTLRPRGAYVSGAGAYTSGPLSFMDIYDKMCFTISSAGGRRGAQMATFDVSHPDVLDFIRAKRESGRLRQFNLSLLITAEFMEAVKADADWPLVFPVLAQEVEQQHVNLEDAATIVWRDWPTKKGLVVNPVGQVACKVYRTIKARRLWDMIMASTYDYAEPGFILIDEYNEMNNNWFCEDIRATNPCVSGDTLILTKEHGEVPIRDLVGESIIIWNGFEYSEVTPQITGRDKELLEIRFSNQRQLRCTRNHKFVLSNGTRIEADTLKIGDELQAFHLPNQVDVVKVAVVDISPVGMVDTVYCFTEPKNHTGVFNGVMTGQCGEQGLPPYGACNLGSINLTCFVHNPFTPHASFDWDAYRKTVAIFTRMLDNVVEINGLPLEQQRHEIITKRRHGMGYLGLGSTLTMLGMRYGFSESLAFTEDVTKEMALTGWRVALELAEEKGPAPVLTQDFAVTAEMLRKRPEMVSDGYKEGDTLKGRVLHAKYSRYMQRVAEVDPTLVEKLATVGARFTHHSSIAPTGTISLSLANNASNGIEPSFAHHYKRNVIVEGKKTKQQVDVFSFELLAYRALINPKAMPYSENTDEKLPDCFVSADDITPKEHVDIQAAAQKWIDSSISKTANVPTDFPYEQFKDIYLYAYEQGLKGCTTFRFNPEVFQGVLVKEKDLENTTYRFTLADGSVVEAKGNEEIEYDGEIHTAANLFDAIKEGYYGRY